MRTSVTTDCSIRLGVSPLLNEHQVAEILGVSVASLRRWRLLRRGPKFLKLNSAVRYSQESITQWLATRPTGGEQTKGVQ